MLREVDMVGADQRVVDSGYIDGIVGYGGMLYRRILYGPRRDVLEAGNHTIYSTHMA